MRSKELFGVLLQTQPSAVIKIIVRQILKRIYKKYFYFLILGNKSLSITILLTPNLLSEQQSDHINNINVMY